MVDMKTQVQPQPHQQQPAENPRKAIQERRNRRLRLIKGNQPETIKVYAANEALLDALRHPANGMRFGSSMEQGVEWPNDSFTKRRIADGSVRTDGPGSGEMAEPDESLNAREQAAARAPKPKEEANGKTESKSGSKGSGQSSPMPPPSTAPAA
jgi:hypothetical protein